MKIGGREVNDEMRVAVEGKRQAYKEWLPRRTVEACKRYTRERVEVNLKVRAGKRRDVQ